MVDSHYFQRQCLFLKNLYVLHCISVLHVLLSEKHQRQSLNAVLMAVENQRDTLAPIRSYQYVVYNVTNWSTIRCQVLLQLLHKFVATTNVSWGCASSCHEVLLTDNAKYARIGSSLFKHDPEVENSCVENEFLFNLMEKKQFCVVTEEKIILIIKTMCDILLLLAYYWLVAT